MNWLLLIFLFIIFLVLLKVVFRLSKIRVWVSTMDRRKSKWIEFGIMDYKKDQTVPSVRLIGQSLKSAIGRIKMGENEDDNAYVQMLSTCADEETDNPQYHECGYISQDGYIYQQLSLRKKPEKIGYLARPSKPNTPTVVGERNWKSLWLKCQLNAYAGEPQEDNSKKARKKRIPVAKSYFKSFRSTSREAMPPEARAAAFGMFYNKLNKHNYQEYYETPFYGWKDTALLSSLIYAVVYSVYYLLWVKVLHNHMVGLHYFRIIPLLLAYPILWAIVRRLKINSIDKGSSIQPLLILFNKSLGQKGIDRLIILCCAITLGFTLTYYRFDFVPLALVVMLGVGINKIGRLASKRWIIDNPFAEPETEEDTEQELSNPEGDITRTYNWALDSEANHDVTGTLTLYFDSQYIDDLRYLNPFYDQHTDKPIRESLMEMFLFVKEHRSVNARLRYLVSQINKIADRNGLLDQDRIQFALDFVQEPNIRFMLNRDSKAIHQYEDYIRYPDETLYDKEADSNSKSFLAAMIFHYMGYNAVMLYSRIQNHGAIGIEIRNEWISDGLLWGKPLDEVSFTYNDRRYLFCETTSDGFRLGGTMNGMHIDDFEDKIEFPLSEDRLEESTEKKITRIYNWDLDPRFGKALHGQYTIEFDTEKISDLRQLNPFLGYAETGGSYEDNIRAIFSYLRDDDERTSLIREITHYLRQTVQEANLDEVHLLQFTLDFCQEPNIHYCVDEQSQGIGFQREYMRFPDEVLYDKEGDCDCKSSLAAALLHELGYNVAIMISEKKAHAAVGVEYNESWLAGLDVENPDNVILEYNGKKYLYCETTGDGFKLGQIRENDTIHDFETVVEIPK